MSSQMFRYCGPDTIAAWPVVQPSASFVQPDHSCRPWLGTRSILFTKFAKPAFAANQVRAHAWLRVEQLVRAHGDRRHDLVVVDARLHAAPGSARRTNGSRNSTAFRLVAVDQLVPERLARPAEQLLHRMQVRGDVVALLRLRLHFELDAAHRAASHFELVTLRKKRKATPFARSTS